MAVNNSTIIDSMRLHMSNDFQQRVPSSSQNGVDAAEVILKNEVLFNEFASALPNLVASQIVQDTDFHNPLAVFKRPELLPEGGSIVEEMAVGMLKAKGYDLEATSLFKVNKAEVYAKFHTVNREDRYDITINNAELRKALLNPTGLNTFIMSMLARPALSDEYDEFNIMVQLLGSAYFNNHVKRIKTPISDINAATADELKRLSYNIRATAKKMSLVPTTQYNAEGVPMRSNQSDLVLITTPEVTAALDVNVLADAFNIDRADLAGHVVEIPEFPMEGAYAMLVDRDWFLCADYLRTIGYFWNPEQLNHNYYLHHWGVYSYSRFANAVVFCDSEDLSDIVDIDLTGITAKVMDSLGDTVTKVNDKAQYSLGVTPLGSITPANEDFRLPDSFKCTGITIATADGKAKKRTLGTSVDFRTGRIKLQSDLVAGDVVKFSVESTYVNPSAKKASPALTSEVSVTVS